jgi:hypothetical protein
MTRLKLTKWHPLALSLAVGSLIALIFVGSVDCRRTGTQRVRTVRKGTTRRIELIEA